MRVGSSTVPSWLSGPVVLGLALFLTPSLGASATPPPVRAITLHGSTLVPLRYIAEWLGAQVDFNARENSMTLALRGKSIRLHLGAKQAFINDAPTMLSSPAIERSGVTYVPLRFVGEALGAQVQWDAANQRAIIAHPGSGERLALPARSETGPTKRDSWRTRAMAPEAPVSGGWVGSGSLLYSGVTIHFVVVKGGKAVRSIAGISEWITPRGVDMVKESAVFSVPDELAINRGKFGSAQAPVEGTFDSPRTASGKVHVTVRDSSGLGHFVICGWSARPE